MSERDLKEPQAQQRRLTDTKRVRVVMSERYPTLHFRPISSPVTPSPAGEIDVTYDLLMRHVAAHLELDRIEEEIRRVAREQDVFTFD